MFNLLIDTAFQNSLNYCYSIYLLCTINHMNVGIGVDRTCMLNVPLDVGHHAFTAYELLPLFQDGQLSVIPSLPAFCCFIANEPQESWEA